MRANYKTQGWQLNGVTKSFFYPALPWQHFLPLVSNSCSGSNASDLRGPLPQHQEKKGLFSWNDWVKVSLKDLNRAVVPTLPLDLQEKQPQELLLLSLCAVETTTRVAIIIVYVQSKQSQELLLLSLCAVETITRVSIIIVMCSRNNRKSCYYYRYVQSKQSQELLL